MVLTATAEVGRDNRLTPVPQVRATPGATVSSFEVPEALRRHSPIAAGTTIADLIQEFSATRTSDFGHDHDSASEKGPHLKRARVEPPADDEAATWLKVKRRRA